MVQVIKRMKVNGKVHEHRMSFSDSEWELIQKHYPFGGTSFELAGKKEKEKKEFDTPGRKEGDDKPNMKDYNVVKDRGMQLFKEEKWEKALYYFETAYKLKGFNWLGSKISQCKKNAQADLIAKP